jgi:hypothetical protein
MATDLDALKKAVEKLGYTLFQATLDAFMDEAELIKEDSMLHCPVAPDGGTLRGSHEIVGPVKEGDEFLIWVQVGGPSDDYAQAVHEHLSQYSPPSWKKAEEEGRGIHWNATGTGPKFLENAARARLDGMQERVMAKARARAGLS